MKIMAVFPENTYLGRKIRVVHNGRTIAKLGRFEELDLPGKEEVSFKLDFHKTTIKGNDQDKFLVYFDYRPYFPFDWWDLIFTNALRLKKVKTFDEKTVNQIIKKAHIVPLERNGWIDAINLLHIVSFALILVLRFLRPGLFNNSHFVWIVSLVGLFGAYRLLKDKTLNVDAYKMRTGAGILMLFLLALKAKLIVWKSLLLALIAIMLLLLLKWQWDRKISGQSLSGL